MQEPPFGLAWATEVRAVVNPVMAAAGVEFDDGRYMEDSRSILWEAAPQAFVARYPDCGLVESYGGPEEFSRAYCIDYWVHALPDEGLLRLELEGWNLPEIYLRANGARWDGLNLATVLARILDVDGDLVR